MVSVLLDGVTKAFPEGDALSNITLRVEDGTSVVLLGPSGSGKTTVLRLIAGVEQPDSGEILFDGAEVGGLAPFERNIAMFSQENTLYPHMTARRNIGFPLQARNTAKPERAKRVEAEARAFAITRMLERMPSQMSAGQQRLVQLARTMVRVPDVFLIDEPFGALDASHRRQLRAELRSLQTGYEVTTVYATHDQEDAMALADLLVVVDRGRVRQAGPPIEVYRRPADTFVAQFIGSPEMSLLEATVRRGSLSVAGFKIGSVSDLPASVLVGVRPEDWRTGSHGVEAFVTSTRDVGPFVLTSAGTEAGDVVLRTSHELGDQDRLLIRPGRYALFDTRSGEALFHSEP